MEAYLVVNNYIAVDALALEHQTIGIHNTDLSITVPELS